MYLNCKFFYLTILTESFLLSKTGAKECLTIPAVTNFVLTPGKTFQSNFYLPYRTENSEEKQRFKLFEMKMHKHKTSGNFSILVQHHPSEWGVSLEPATNQGSFRAEDEPGEKVLRYCLNTNEQEEWRRNETSQQTLNFQTPNGSEKEKVSLIVLHHESQQISELCLDDEAKYEFELKCERSKKRIGEIVVSVLGEEELTVVAFISVSRSPDASGWEEALVRIPSHDACDRKMEFVLSGLLLLVLLIAAICFLSAFKQKNCSFKTSKIDTQSDVQCTNLTEIDRARCEVPCDELNTGSEIPNALYEGLESRTTTQVNNEEVERRSGEDKFVMENEYYEPFAEPAGGSNCRRNNNYS